MHKNLYKECYTKKRETLLNQRLSLFCTCPNLRLGTLFCMIMNTCFLYFKQWFKTDFSKNIDALKNIYAISKHVTFKTVYQAFIMLKAHINHRIVISWEFING